MVKNQIHRSLLAIAAIVALCSMPALSRAEELHGIVVVGIPAEKIASEHPTPEYPQTALNLRISGRGKLTGFPNLELTHAVA